VSPRSGRISAYNDPVQQENLLSYEKMKCDLEVESFVLQFRVCSAMVQKALVHNKLVWKECYFLNLRSFRAATSSGRLCNWISSCAPSVLIMSVRSRALPTGFSRGEVSSRSSTSRLLVSNQGGGCTMHNSCRLLDCDRDFL
jgi:hypothetical protein